MSLQFSDRVFSVAQATLTAKIPDPYWLGKYHPQGDPRLVWMLHIHCDEHLVDGDSCKPFLCHESLRFPIRRWVDIAGQSVEWNSPWNDKLDEPNGVFDVFESGEVPTGRLRFLTRNTNRFMIEWEGVAEPFPLCPEPFSLTAEAVFTELRVDGSGHDSEESLRQRLLQCIDADRLVGEPMVRRKFNYDDGVETVYAIYRPLIG
jgi:hypothetical protein